MRLLLNRPFEFSYVDEAIDQYYKQEADQVALFNTFSSLAIFISLLGLIAMATYTAEQRKKEVSIRKVLGASLQQLVFLLNRENGILSNRSFSYCDTDYRLCLTNLAF